MSFKKTHNISQKKKNIVCGYMRSIQKSLGKSCDNPYYTINDLILNLCLSYFKYIDSIIFKDQNEIDKFFGLLEPQLQTILHRNDFYWRLIFRKSRDCGKDENHVSSFHKHCDGHLNTVILVKSNFNHIFGGFTTKDWGANTQWTKDNSAFLFVIRSQLTEFNQPKIYKNKRRDISAVFIHSASGPCFGSGYDLVLHTDGVVGTKSKLGVSYEGTANELCGGNSIGQYGHYWFDIVQYEVFAIE